MGQFVSVSEASPPPPPAVRGGAVRPREAARDRPSGIDSVGGAWPLGHVAGTVPGRLPSLGRLQSTSSGGLVSGQCTGTSTNTVSEQSDRHQQRPSQRVLCVLIHRPVSWVLCHVFHTVSVVFRFSFRGACCMTWCEGRVGYRLGSVFCTMSVGAQNQRLSRAGVGFRVTTAGFNGWEKDAAH